MSKKKQQYWELAEEFTASESAALDLSVASESLAHAGIKDLIPIVLAAVSLGVFFHSVPVVAVVLFIAFLFARVIFLHTDPKTILILDARTKKVVGRTDTRYTNSIWGLIFLVLLIAGYIWLCSELFPSYGLYQVFVMFLGAAVLLLKPVITGIYKIILGNKISRLCNDCIGKDKTPLREAYYKGLCNFDRIGRGFWLVSIALLVVGLGAALIRYNAKAPELEACFDPVAAYYSDTAPHAESRTLIPEEVLGDLSCGKFEIYSSHYYADYRFETEYTGFLMEYDVSVHYEYVESGGPRWVVREHELNSETVKAVNHSGTWTGTGTDDKSPDLFAPECSFTLTFDSLTETEAKGTLVLTATDGTELYNSAFSGTASREGNVITANVVLEKPRQTFAELHTELCLEINPATEKLSFGLAYPSATLTLNRE